MSPNLEISLLRDVRTLDSSTVPLQYCTRYECRDSKFDKWGVLRFSLSSRHSQSDKSQIASGSKIAIRDADDGRGDSSVFAVFEEDAEPHDDTRLKDGRTHYHSHSSFSHALYNIACLCLMFLVASLMTIDFICSRWSWRWDSHNELEKSSQQMMGMDISKRFHLVVSCQCGLPFYVWRRRISIGNGDEPMGGDGAGHGWMRGSKDSSVRFDDRFPEYVAAISVISTGMVEFLQWRVLLLLGTYEI